METTVNGYIYYMPGVVRSRDLMCSLIACRGNCMHRRTCVVSKCIVVWKTVPFHDEKLLKNTSYIPETIQSHTETRKKMNYTMLIFWLQVTFLEKENFQQKRVSSTNNG